jgi:DNA-damage-inducible protein J
METVNVTVRMERQTRDDAARLFSGLGVSTTQSINVVLKQAVREQRIPLEVAARQAVGHRAESLEEQNRLTASTAASSEPFHP